MHDNGWCKRQMCETDRLYVGEEFGVINYLKFTSPWSIAIEDTSMTFITPVRSIENSVSSQLAGKIFNKEEIGAELNLAVCDKLIDHNNNIAQYRITWKSFIAQQYYY
ncbi:hypothetical protein NQ317_011650 [Molorchus minor]|uniref:Uncharacterized protein n=1 Tax=Molorchus minor TaxID=1323400 RepID=A0ABQ9JY00_9CUCU|nr:hypothetical protein NQ317_011650 [Molorchus minor]